MDQSSSSGPAAQRPSVLGLIFILLSACNPTINDKKGEEWVEAQNAKKGGAFADLTGQIANSQFPDGVVTSSKIDPAYTSTLATKTYADSYMLGYALPAISTFTNGQTIRWNTTTSSWEVFSPGTAAGVTSVTMGSGLSDTGTATVPIIGISTGGVTSAMLAADAVTSAKIVDGAIVNADINAAAAIDVSKINSGVTANRVLTSDGSASSWSTVTSAMITDATIAAADLASDAVTTVKILDANVTTAKINNLAVTPAKLSAGDATAAGLVLTSTGTGTTAAWASWSQGNVNFVSKSAAYTLGTSDNIVSVNAVAGALTMTLPTAASAGSGRQYTIKKNDSSANGVTVAANGAETIDGSNTLILSSPQQFVTVVSTGSAWQVISFPSVPVGTVIESANSSAPTGYLLCDGSAISRTTYAALFAAIGTTYGSGDGSTTFNIPDRQGNVGRGAGLSVGYTENVTITLGAKTDDAFQGHYHSSSLSSGLGGSPYYLDGNSNVAPNGISAGATGGSFTSLSVTVQAPTTDGTNGTPRTAVETRVKSLGMNYFIKY